MGESFIVVPTAPGDVGGMGVAPLVRLVLLVLRGPQGHRDTLLEILLVAILVDRGRIRQEKAEGRGEVEVGAEGEAR